MAMTEDWDVFFNEDEFAIEVDYYRYNSVTEEYTLIDTVNMIQNNRDMLEEMNANAIIPTMTLTHYEKYDYRPHEYIDIGGNYATAGKPLYMILNANKDGFGLVNIDLTKDY